jgi:hypothetical protein
MEPRFAFTAQFWGDGAVVCRAVEDRPGPVVEQQFGQFPTWTQANACASKLNEGLGLDAIDVRHIVTSSFLATACVVQAALASDVSWRNSSTGIAARAVQLRFVFAELTLALTFCDSARLLSGSMLNRLFRNAQKALEHSKRFITFFDGDRSELAGIAQSADALNMALQNLSFSFSPESDGWGVSLAHSTS